MIFYDFGPIDNFMATSTATVTRTAADTIGSDGYKVTGAATTYNSVPVSISPANSDLYRKMEADYSITLVVIFSSFQFKAQDIVTVGSVSYQVEKAADWQSGGDCDAIARQL